MRALVKTEPGPGAELTDIDKSSIGPKDLLVKPEKMAICGTDLDIYEWAGSFKNRVDLPHILGHEFSGKVVEVGDQVDTLEEGDYIAAETHISCGSCKQCLTGNQHICENLRILGVDTNGAFAEYARIPESCGWKIPEDFSNELGAIIEPIGGAVHTTMTPDVRLSNVLITGAGPIGMAATIAADYLGASEVIVSDLSPERLKIVEDLGASKTLNPKEEDIIDAIMSITNGRGVDVLLEMSGSPKALNTGMKSLANKAEVALFGIPPDKVEIDVINDVIFKESTIYGVTGREMYKTWYELISLLERVPDFSSIITRTFQIEDYEEAFEVASSRKEGKIILTW